MSALSWFLERQIDSGRKVLRIRVAPVPFRVGRRRSSDLVLESPHASGEHAELFEREGCLWVRDLGSTNGTFINGERLDGELRLYDQDLLHFGNFAYRVGITDLARETEMLTTETIDPSSLLLPLARGEQVRQLIAERQLQAVYQPLVKLAPGAEEDWSSCERVAFEALGRATLDGNEVLPTDLFLVAAAMGLEVELSRIFRMTALAGAGELEPLTQIFVNTHPSELGDSRALLESLRELRDQHPNLDIVLEIHEAAVADSGSLRGFSRRLAELGIGLAFDDFGTGQARLLELAEISPQYLKFDGAWIHNLHLASRRKREIVQTLVNLALDLGVTPVAECIERREEAQVCADLGFPLAQGFLFGRPAAASRFLSGAVA